MSEPSQLELARQHYEQTLARAEDVFIHMGRGYVMSVDVFKEGMKRYIERLGEAKR